MTIVYRSVKGSNLTPTEVDNNFHDVDNRISTIEGLDIGKSIATIEVDTGGNLMVITYTDSSYDTFVLPTLNWVDLNRGAWQPLTPYFINELVTALGSLWVVAQDHTSEATFDPNAADTGGNFYQLLLKASSVPVYTRSATTYDPIFADANSYNRCTNAAGCTVTIPENADVPFDLDTELHFRQCNTGIVIIDNGSTAVVINGVAGHANNTDTEGAVITLKKVDTDEWDLFGRLEQVTAT